MHVNIYIYTHIYIHTYNEFEVAKDAERLVYFQFLLQNRKGFGICFRFVDLDF